MDDFSEANIEKIKILEKKIYNINEKNKIEYENTLIDNLNFVENLYIQRIDYINLIKADSHICFFLFFTTALLSTIIKKSCDAKKPFIFIDNNRLLHNKLYLLKKILRFTINLSSFVFLGFFLYNYHNLYLLRNLFNDEEIIEKKLNNKYIQKLNVSKKLHI
jgi:hypothetical protein